MKHSYIKNRSIALHTVVNSSAKSLPLEILTDEIRTCSIVNRIESKLRFQVWQPYSVSFSRIASKFSPTV